MASRANSNPPPKLSSEEQDARLKAGGQRLAQLRLALGGMLPFGDGELRLGPPLCLVFEGWDASGKGGAIKRLTAPAGRAPRPLRLRRGADARREAPSLPASLRPRAPRMGRHDRRRPLLVRPGARRARGGLCHRGAVAPGLRRDQRLRGGPCSRRDADREVLARGLRRRTAQALEKREKDPLKSYKLTDEDWRNRGKRPAYERAVDEMLERTDTGWAPWIVVQGDHKHHARVAVMEAAIACVEDGLRRQGFEPPVPLG